MKSHPEMVIDLSNRSGEYCMNTWKVGGSHMTRFRFDLLVTATNVK